MGSTAAPQHFTTSSPPRARRTGGSWTSWFPEQIRSPHLFRWQAVAEGPVQFWKMSQRSGMLCVMFCENCLYSIKLWVCNFTITVRLKYSLLAPISGWFPEVDTRSLKSTLCLKKWVYFQCNTCSSWFKFQIMFGQAKVLTDEASKSETRHYLSVSIFHVSSPSHCIQITKHGLHYSDVS